MELALDFDVAVPLVEIGVKATDEVDIGWVEIEDPGKVPTTVPGAMLRVDVLAIADSQETCAEVIMSSGITGMLAAGIGFDTLKVAGSVEQANHVIFALNEVNV